MSSLSIILPDQLAKASQEAAAELGISRTQFIRQAIIHELDSYRSQCEQKAMAKGLLSMKNNEHYLGEVDELDTLLNSELPKEKDAWWNKKTS